MNIVCKNQISRIKFCLSILCLGGVIGCKMTDDAKSYRNTTLKADAYHAAIYVPPLFESLLDTTVMNYRWNRAVKKKSYSFDGSIWLEIEYDLKRLTSQEYAITNLEDEYRAEKEQFQVTSDSSNVYKQKINA